MRRGDLLAKALYKSGRIPVIFSTPSQWLVEIHKRLLLENGPDDQ